MKRKTVSILMAIVLMLSVVGVFMPTASSSLELPDYEPEMIEAEFREKNLPVDTSTIPESSEVASQFFVAQESETKIWLTLDDYNGYYFFDTFELMAEGSTCEIWVQTDLSWPEEDPRETPVVTEAQAEYLLDEFENNILPTDSNYFGTPDYHDGSNSLLESWESVPPGYYFDEGGKNVILVSNIRDENYYNASYPYYIAGFYSPTFEAYFDRNVISIDAYDWSNRIGPDADRPYVYESTIAHEYQHLIHDDYNPSDALFMNEGCSMYAEILCGYPPSWGHINSYLSTPDNSLTEWGDQGDINILADYGASTLWAVYLSDHYGGADFISHFVQAGIPGIGGINAALEHFGYTENFDDVYHDWKIANLIHTDHPGEGKYNYTTLNLGGGEAGPLSTYDVNGLPIHTMWGTDFGTTETILGYDTGVSMVGPYGSDYIVLDEWKQGALSFNGDDEAIYGWRQTEEGDWYSGSDNLMNTLLYAEAYVDEEDPTLELTTYWDIEDYWDFGFVQISTDGGNTWISLENDYTTYDHDPSAHPDVVDNLPGLTGWSENWVTMTFDLEDFAGETVMIGFRYMTDWATTYEGWYISDASVSGEPLTLTPNPPEADFEVTPVYAFKEHGDIVYSIEDNMLLNDETEEGSITQQNKKAKYSILIVSSTSEKGFVDYNFQAQPWHGHREQAPPKINQLK